MDAVAIDSLEGIRALVKEVHRLDEPLILLDGNEECLVAMRPAVLERILFDSSLVNCEGGPALRF